MKKAFNVFMLYILLTPVFVSAYQTIYYNISFNMNEYIKDSDDSFYKESGDGFDVIVSPISSPIEYDNDNLNYLVNYNADLFKDYILEIQKEYDYIDATNSHFDKVELKEISTFGKNNYKCFHYILDYTIGNVNLKSEIYQTSDKTRIYALNLLSVGSNYLKTEEVNNIIKSFEIINYDDPTIDNNTSDEEQKDTIKEVIDKIETKKPTEKIIEKKENVVKEPKKVETLKEEKSSNNYLSSLTVLNNDINFSKDNNDYYIHYTSVDEIKVLAEDSKSNIDIKDNGNLGLVTIKVTSEDGKERNYYLHKLTDEVENINYSKVDKKKIFIIVAIIFVTPIIFAIIGKYKKYRLFKKL